MTRRVRSTLFAASAAVLMSACATTSGLQEPLGDFAKASDKALAVTLQYFVL